MFTATIRSTARRGARSFGKSHARSICTLASLVSITIIGVVPAAALPTGQSVITTVVGTGVAGSTGDGGAATAARINAPRDATLGPDGSLYVTDSDGNRIRKVSPSGIITTVVGTGVAGSSGDGGQATAAMIRTPHDVFVDATGSIYFADSGNSRVRKVETNGVIRTIAGTGVPGYSGDGGPATSARLQNPKAIAFWNGSMYIADGSNNRIRKVDPSGVITTVAGTGAGGFGGDGGQATSALLNQPQRIAFDATGNLYIADSGNNRVRKIAPSGIITTVAGTGVAGFSGDGGVATSARLRTPRGVSVDQNGDIFIADSDNNRVRVVYPSGMITTIAGTGAAAFGGDGGPAGSARLANPRGVNIDASGRLYISDTGNNRIRLVDLGPQDTTPPSIPGTPAGQSTRAGTIDLIWAASSDAGSATLTYRIYRDDGLSPIGQVSSSSTTTVGYPDAGLTAGSVHTYSVVAVDGANNASASSAVSDPITVTAENDTVPPSAPGRPTGQSAMAGTIALTWAASTDDGSTTLSYQVWRDGLIVGSVISSSTTTVGFTDSGLAAGSTHVYHVVSVDGAANSSAPSPDSDPITVLSTVAPIFSDDFASGGFTKWSGVTRLTIDPTTGGVAVPSARAQVTNLSAWAFKLLPSTYAMACVSSNVNVASIGAGPVVLIRLRTAANGPVSRVFLTTGGVLFAKSDASGAQLSSGVTLGSGWHVIELCTTVGSAGSVTLRRDGVAIVNTWTANLGSSPIGIIEIGDAAASTVTDRFDDVVVDQAPG